MLIVLGIGGHRGASKGLSAGRFFLPLSVTALRFRSFVLMAQLHPPASPGWKQSVHVGQPRRRGGVIASGDLPQGIPLSNSPQNKGPF